MFKPNKRGDQWLFELKFGVSIKTKWIKPLLRLSQWFTRHWSLRICKTCFRTEKGGSRGQPPAAALKIIWEKEWEIILSNISYHRVQKLEIFSSKKVRNRAFSPQLLKIWISETKFRAFSPVLMRILKILPRFSKLQIHLKLKIRIFYTEARKKK